LHFPQPLIGQARQEVIFSLSFYFYAYYDHLQIFKLTYRTPLQIKEQDDILDNLKDQPSLRVVVSLSLAMERQLHREIRVLQKDNTQLLDTVESR
jgi:hypothetical protein